MYKTRLLNKDTVRFIAAGLVCLTACIAVSSNDAEKVKEARPLVTAVATSPETPLAVTIFGESVDITRYNMHEGYDREISSFTYFHSTVLLLFKRANCVFPVIEPILKANGIPDDFKYLAVIESHLDPRVSSPARAVGTWQFLEGTGKQYGLTITQTVDERCDVEKSTLAACKYLKDAYNRYGDWFNVAASYNGGMGHISGELAKQQEESALDLWLVQETTRYPYRIMAIKQLFENPYKYGFVLHARDLYKPIQTRDVSVYNDVMDLAGFAKEQGVTYADVKRFNPWLRDRKLITLGKTYKIRIPEAEDMYYKKANTYVHDSRWVVE
jgi:hypothetical protein